VLKVRPNKIFSFFTCAVLCINFARDAFVNFNPLLSKLNYETVEITQEMILYGSSELCAIHDGPHLLINMENYIPY